jgi:hypothetical protein
LVDDVYKGKTSGLLFTLARGLHDVSFEIVKLVMSAGDNMSFWIGSCGVGVFAVPFSLTLSIKIILRDKNIYGSIWFG